MNFGNHQIVKFYVLLTVHLNISM